MNKIDIEKTSEGNHKAYSELIETLEKVKDAIKKQNYGIAMDILCKPYPAFQVITLSSELEESEDERIRKAILWCIRTVEHELGCKDIEGLAVAKLKSWLEKQGEKDEEILILKDQIESLHAAIKAIKETHRIELEKRGEQKPTEWSLPYGKNETAEHLIALAECLEMDGDCLFNRLSGDDYGKLLRVLAGELKEIKPAGNDEPKFKIGDLITNGILVGKIDEIHELGYHAYFGDHYADVPDAENWHKWTIQDAKDGDVLVCESGWTCIFKTLVNDETFSSYCFMDNTKWFCETGSECHTLKEEFVKAYNGKIYPATKEQRDLLFQKMHEAGYEWDADAKVLKEIEQKSAEWTKEDIQMYRNILSYLSEPSPLKEVNGKSREQLLDWFKGLKDRYTWNPSDEQMDALRYVFQHYTPTATDTLAWDALQTIELMLEQLKK